jgi:TonB family protein
MEPISPDDSALLIAVLSSAEIKEVTQPSPFPTEIKDQTSNAPPKKIATKLREKVVSSKTVDKEEKEGEKEAITKKPTAISPIKASAEKDKDLKKIIEDLETKKEREIEAERGKEEEKKRLKAEEEARQKRIDMQTVLTPAVYDNLSLKNSPPKYPITSRKEEEEGEVILLVRVGADGRAVDVVIYKSSGYARLDNASMYAVKSWRFTPAKNKLGLPIESVIQVPFVFKVSNDTVN